MFFLWTALKAEAVLGWMITLPLHGFVGLYWRSYIVPRGKCELNLGPYWLYAVMSSVYSYLSLESMVLAFGETEDISKVCRQTRSEIIFSLRLSSFFGLLWAINNICTQKENLKKKMRSVLLVGLISWLVHINQLNSSTNLMCVMIGYVWVVRFASVHLDIRTFFNRIMCQKWDECSQKNNIHWLYAYYSVSRRYMLWTQFYSINKPGFQK